MVFVCSLVRLECHMPNPNPNPNPNPKLVWLHPVKYRQGLWQKHQPVLVSSKTALQSFDSFWHNSGDMIVPLKSRVDRETQEFDHRDTFKFRHSPTSGVSLLNGPSTVSFVFSQLIFIRCWWYTYRRDMASIAFTDGHRFVWTEKNILLYNSTWLFTIRAIQFLL